MRENAEIIVGLLLALAIITLGILVIITVIFPAGAYTGIEIGARL